MRLIWLPFIAEFVCARANEMKREQANKDTSTDSWTIAVVKAALWRVSSTVTENTFSSSSSFHLQNYLAHSFTYDEAPVTQSKQMCELTQSYCMANINAKQTLNSYICW